MGEEAGPEGGRAGAEGAGDEEPGQTAAGDPNAQAGGPDTVDALERALGELDGEILDERIATAATRPAGPAPAVDSSGEAVPAPPRAEPNVAQVPSAPLPPDRPDARDDDVVARQLREAAMAETDPVLREQLWEEYRRYKDGL